MKMKEQLKERENWKNGVRILKSELEQGFIDCYFLNQSKKDSGKSNFKINK